MRKSSEIGRSLLEILAVLVIMLVLVLGGLYLWQAVRQDNDVNVIKQRIVAMRTERQTNINSLTNQTGSNVRKEENVARGARLTMENGRGEANKDYFWITASKIDSSLCVALSQIDRENIQAVKITPEDSNACNKKPEVTFYFPKYENATGTPDRSQQPARCPANFWGESCNKPCPTVGVESCDSDGLVCKAGYYRDGDTCEKCSGPRKYSNSGYVTCRECPAGQKANADHTGCDDCGQGDICDCPNGQTADGSGGCECPGYSSLTVRSGSQISGTQCYCESGYKLDSAKTGCVACNVGDECGCPNGQKWDGKKCNNPSCPPNSSYEKTKPSGGRSETNVAGCYCDEATPKWSSEIKRCEECFSNGDCKSGQYCYFEAQNGRKSNGECRDLEPGSLAECSGGACLNKKFLYYSFNVSDGIQTYTAQNWCQAHEYRMATPEDLGLDFSSIETPSKRGLTGYKRVSNYSGLNEDITGDICLGNVFGEGYAPVVEFRSDNTTIYHYTTSYTGKFTRLEGVTDYTALNIALCYVGEGCPANSSTTVREGQQIGTTGCYCNEGYKLNDTQDSCVSCVTGDDCGCPDGQKWDGTACVPEEQACGAYPNTSTTVRSGLQITGTQCYCNEGYRLNADKTQCEVDCNENQCCQAMIDAGFVMDTDCTKDTCLKVASETKQKDNTFWIENYSNGSSSIFYKGDVVINENFNYPTCGIFVKGSLQAKANITLRSLMVTGQMTLQNNKQVTADLLYAGALSVEKGASVSAKDFGTSGPLSNGTTANGLWEEITSVGDFKLINHGTITSDNGEISSQVLTNYGTITLSKAAIDSHGGCAITNTGTIEIRSRSGNPTSSVGSIDNSGTFIYRAGLNVPEASIINSGTFSALSLGASSFEQTAGTTNIEGSIWIGQALSLSFLGMYEDPNLRYGTNDVKVSDIAMKVSGGTVQVSGDVVPHGTQTDLQVSGGELIVLGQIYNTGSGVKITSNSSSIKVKGEFTPFRGSYTQTGGEVIVCKGFSCQTSKTTISGGTVKVKEGYYCDADGIEGNVNIPWCSE